MRRLLIALIASFAANAIAADATFPYKAYVTSDDVYIRSGPGDKFYPTDNLKAGTEVEVYRHDPSGWYAIRPPKESFSWVSSRHVQIGANHLGTITDERVAARVGSRFSDMRDVIQVRLNKGERVELLDPPRDDVNNAPAVAWYKIAPPAGEFRWVSGRFVDPNFVRDGTRRTDTRRTENAARDATVDLTGRAAALPLVVTPVPRTASPAQYQKQLDDLELELSAIVVEDPAAWDLSDLRQRAETLFDQAKSATERGHSRMLVGKIARFDDIKRRKLQLASSAPAAAATPSGPPPSPLPAGDPDGRFDARGQLIRVPNPKPGGPQYAILDAAGNLRCYVSPAPGVNLRSYVGQQVGITGIRGYMPEQRATHVMARHVNVVEGGTIR